MTDDAGAYFFDFPNSLARFTGARSLLAAGIGLVFIGLACLVNGMIGLAFGGVKHFGHVAFYNQHWINVGYVLAGIMVILLDRQKQNFLLFGSVALTIMSVCMSVGVTISDCLNLKWMSSLTENKARLQFFVSDNNVSASIAYSSVDLVCNLTAFVLSVYAWWKVVTAVGRFYSPTGSKCTRVILAGVALFGVAFLNFIIHLVEASENNLLVNYTMDEHFWNLVAIATSILIVNVGVNGSRIMTHAALLLCLILYYPTVEYMIFEYRWIVHYALVKHAFLSNSHVLTTQLGLATNIIFTLTNFGVCIVLANQLYQKGAAWFDLSRTYSKNVKKQLVVVPFTLIIISAMIIIIDIANSQKGSLYRWFMASDQKLPFFLIPAGLVTLCLHADSAILYLLYPLSFTLSILAIEPALRTLKAFLYLSHSLYFPGHVCEMLRFPPEKCPEMFETHGATAHFLEALLSFVGMMFAIHLAYVVGRIMGIYGLAIAPRNVTDQQHRKVHRLIIAVRVLGACHIGLSLLAFCLTGVAVKLLVTEYTSGIEILQNYVMFPAYYVTMLCVGVCQIVWARNDVARFPLRLIAIMMLSCARIVEIFIIMDYRTVGGMTTSLALIIFGEILSLTFTFTTLIVAGHLLNASTSALPQFDFLEDDPDGEWSQDMTTFYEDQMYHTPDFNPVGVLDMRDD